MDITIRRPAEPLRRASATDFGVDPSNADNTEALQKAFDWASREGGVELFLPTGRYRFAKPEKIRLVGAKNVVFDGRGSELVFSEKSYFDIVDCDTVVFRNMILDWDWEGAYRLADMIRVVAKGPGYVDFVHFEVDEAQDRPWFTINQYDACDLTPGCEDGKEFWAMTPSIRVERLGGNLSRVRHEGLLDRVMPGEVFCLRYETYGTDAIVLIGSSNVTVERVTVWSTPGMAFIITGGTSHYRFDRCVVGLKPGANRRMSATADSMHIGNSCGYGIVEGCDFAFAGDDAINIHDNVGLVLEVSDEKSVVVQKRLTCSVGDEVGLMRADAFRTPFVSTVVKKEEASQTAWKLTLADPLPAEAVVNSIFYNRKFDSAHYIFRNNYFHENRARGLLLGSSHGLVENNTLYKTQGAAILTVVDIAPNWSEGTGVEDLVVRNNRFIECNVNDWTPMIDIRTMLPDGPSGAPVFKNLVFEGNLFADAPGPVLSVNSAEGVLIKGNTFVAQKERKTKRASRGSIEVKLSSEVFVSDNTVVRSDKTVSPLPVSGEAEVSGTKLVDR